MFETVKGFVKTTDIVWKRSVNEARRLLTVDTLIESTMEEGVLNVKLMDQLVMGDSDGKNSMDNGQFDNWAKILLIINARLLREAMNYPSWFIAVKRAIGLVFMSENPFARYDVGVWRARIKIPRPIGMKRGDLVKHGMMPVGIFESIAVGFGNWRQRRSTEVEPFKGLTKTRLPVSYHRAVFGDWDMATREEEADGGGTTVAGAVAAGSVATKVAGRSATAGMGATTAGVVEVEAVAVGVVVVGKENLSGCAAGEDAACVGGSGAAAVGKTRAVAISGEMGPED